MSGNVKMEREAVDRETLEQMVLEACPAEQYYELMDCLEEATDEELWGIVESNFD